MGASCQHFRRGGLAIAVSALFILIEAVRTDAAQVNDAPAVSQVIEFRLAGEPPTPAVPGPKRSLAPASEPKPSDAGKPSRVKSTSPFTEEPLAGTSQATQPSPDMLASLFGGTAGSERLAGTPNMFGDLFAPEGQLVFVSPFPGSGGTADLPLAAGCRRAKVGENNNALPQDRVYFLYNHFQNALDEDLSQFIVGPAQRIFSVDRYTLGVEKTFCNGCWSVELRMPLAGETDFATPGFAISGGQVGNLAVIVKRLIYKSDTMAACVGLGIDTPTGSDVAGNVLVTDFTVHNDAVHLLPYVGLLHKPSERFFWQGFLQLDVAANGNRIDFSDQFNGTGTFGTLKDQGLLYADLSAGYWLYHNPCARALTGFAPLVELHYTTALQDADFVTGRGYVTRSQFSFGNIANHVDMVNCTVGLHAEFASHTLCRVGGVFPLRSGDNRSFDSEVQVQVERRF
jgi:hypothetical protein